MVTQTSTNIYNNLIGKINSADKYGKCNSIKDIIGGFTLHPDSLSKSTESAFSTIKKLLLQYFREDSKCISLISNWAKIEPIYYLTVNHYRDHLLHLFSTYLLGLFLGDRFNVFTEKQKDVEFYGKDRKYHWEGLTLDEKLNAWTFTAFYHDVGYPLQKAKAIRDKLKELYFNILPQFTLNEITIDISQRISGASENCIKEISKGYLRDGNYLHAGGHRNAEGTFQKSLSNFDHGVVSAVLLWDFIFLDSREKNNCVVKEIKNIVRESCVAMALHTMYLKSDYDHIHIRENDLPLTFLLILCDELQEWNRPFSHEKFSELQSSLYSENKTNNQMIELMDIDVDFENNERAINIMSNEKYKDQASKYVEKLNEIFANKSFMLNEPIKFKLKII